MEFRGLFNSIFGGKKDFSTDKRLTSFKTLNTYENVFSEYDYRLSNDITVRSCIDCIARHISKLKPTHIRNTADKMIIQDSVLDKIISRRPNPLMSTADFLYKIAYKAFMSGNCFIYVDRVDGNITGLYVLDYADLEMKEIDGDVYCLFRFANGNKITVPYTDIIHIRRNFGESESLGTAPMRVLQGQLALLDTCKKSLANIVKNSTAMRGYLKYDTPVKPNDREEQVKKFNEIAKENGVGALDMDANYIDLAQRPEATNKEQLDFIRDDIYRFFGLSESILKGNYNEDEWQSFFESVIEPFAVQLGLEFTEKIFSDREQGFGNAIIFDQNRLQYSSTANKVDMIYKLLPQGVMTINQACEILNMPPCDDPEIGNKRFMTLNNDSAANIGGTGGEESSGNPGDNTPAGGGDGSGKS